MPGDVERFGDNARYLGDGVYVGMDKTVPDMVRLCTDDGISSTNVIYLEKPVLGAFIQWLLDTDILTKKMIRDL